MSADTPTPKSISFGFSMPLGQQMHVHTKGDSPLFVLLNQINLAAGAGLDLVAIAAAVAVPAVCGSLMSDDGRCDGPCYLDWCRDNLKEGFEHVTAEHLYSIRCGVLHSGRVGELKKGVERIIFVPKQGGGGFTDCMNSGAFFYSTVQFCQNINRAAVAWWEANKDHPNVKANIGRMMRYYHGGLPPYAMGLTVIA